MKARWKRGQVDGTELLPSRYDEASYGARLEHYADGIEEVIASGTAAEMAR